ncbi:hypothetical protein DFO47_101239 [Arthrobacter sp. AG258]|nr:hypothetical protein DFO47_101239 [Arthrobacter sp. AG258]
MFESLLGFVAQLSLVLWIAVTLTLVIRFVGIRFYRHTARKALAAAAAPAVPDAAVQPIMAPIDPGPATKAKTAPVVPETPAPGEPRAAAQFSALAAHPADV